MKTGLRIFLSGLTVLVFAAILSCSTASSGGGGSSTGGTTESFGTGSFSITINGTTYTGSGIGIFTVETNNIIFIANSSGDASALKNTIQIIYPPTATATGVPYSACGVEYYTNGSSSFYECLVTNTFTSIASSTGQHTTGTFTGSGVLTSAPTSTLTISGSFDEVR